MDRSNPTVDNSPVLQLFGSNGSNQIHFSEFSPRDRTEFSFRTGVDPAMCAQRAFFSGFAAAPYKLSNLFLYFLPHLHRLSCRFQYFFIVKIEWLINRAVLSKKRLTEQWASEQHLSRCFFTQNVNFFGI